MKRLLAPVPIAVLLGVAALVGLLGYGLVSNEPDGRIEQAIASGSPMPAPAISLPRLNGRGHTSLADFEGRVVVLNYWASWCQTCRAESPLLERWQGRIARGGGTVLGVDVHDLTGDALGFAREFGLSYPMLHDADGSSQRQFGVVAYPETFVIDRRGRVVAAKRGPVDEAFMRTHVLPLLGAPS